MNSVKRALMGDKKAQEEITEKGELLPCPICGGEPVITKITTTYLSEKEIPIGTTEVHIFCTKCGIKTNSVLTTDTLIKFWNTRQQLLTDEEMEKINE
jgi:hypothetical protein